MAFHKQCDLEVTGFPYPSSMNIVLKKYQVHFHLSLVKVLYSPKLQDFSVKFYRLLYQLSFYPDIIQSKIQMEQENLSVELSYSVIIHHPSIRYFSLSPYSICSSFLVRCPTPEPLNLLEEKKEGKMATDLPSKALSFHLEMQDFSRGSLGQKCIP